MARYRLVIIMAGKLLIGIPTGDWRHPCTTLCLKALGDGGRAAGADDDGCTYVGRLYG